MDAKKSLGQNFLQDKQVIEKIISAIAPCEGELIVEIGPGEGVLTEQLIHAGAIVVAIELDDRLIPILKEKFKNYSNAFIVHQDILKTDIGKIFSELNLNTVLCEKSVENEKKKNLQSSKGTFRMIGNLPYYITSPIIRKFLEMKQSPREMFFMIQKEVAERICAPLGEMSILSVAVQYYARPEIQFFVSKEAFEPVPKVESAFVLIKKECEKNNENTDLFFRVVRTGFSARRKTLANNIVNGFPIKKEMMENFLLQIDLKEKVRAQDLSVNDWKKITNFLKENYI
ncbi:MAG: ribosomal RNA small subunit methyltransferase A [Candidatus Moraniibacteriota bacterium]|nr:MAG: ribosomal RNA small subunit methyltransferase A [Candidatus Moranbacteria bacterium]